MMANLRDSFNTVYFDSCNGFRINLPEDFGSGFIRGISFHNGFDLIEYSCSFKASVKNNFSVNKIHTLKFIYFSKGSVKHRFEEKDRMHLID